MNENNYATNVLALRRLFKKGYIRKFKHPVRVPQSDQGRYIRRTDFS